MNTLRLSFCLLLLLAQAAVAPSVQAQSDDCPDNETCQPSDNEVIGVSIILTPLGTPVSTYSATILGATVAAYYDAGGIAELYGGVSNAFITWGDLGDGNPTADGWLSTWEVYSQYYLVTEHYLIAQVDYESEGVWYLDPMDFQDVAGFNSQGYLVVDGNAPEEEDYYPDVQDSDIDIGESSDTAVVATPSITSITQQVECNPTCTSQSPEVTLNGVNSSGTLLISGANLTNQGEDPYPSVCVNGMCAGDGSPATAAGLTFRNVTVVMASGTDTPEITVNYSVDGQASSVGTHSITVTTDAGTSNSVGLTVGDPTPAITQNGVVPSQWQAGTTQSFTVTGSGFGTSPKVSITHTDGTAAPEIGTPTVTPMSDSYLSASVFIPAGTAEALTVTVTSQGYGPVGSTSFLPAYSGDPSTSNGVTVEVEAEQATTPQIMFLEQNIANNGAANPAPAVVGQQIALTAVFPAGIVPTNQSWDQPGGLIVGGYIIDTTTSPPGSGQAVALPGTGNCQTFQGGCLTFYWVEAGTGSVNRTVNYHYSLGGQPQPVVAATFQVTAPTNLAVNAPTGLVNIAANSLVKPNAPAIVYGGSLANFGISFTAASTPPQGPVGTNSEYAWVQLRRGAYLTNQTSGNGAGVSATGVQYCKMQSFISAQNGGPANGDPTPALDASFPYATVPPANDNPFYGLQASASGLTVGETKVSESFTMYLMWDPALPADCDPWGVNQHTQATVPTNCTSIPVPLGAVSWSYACDAINTLVQQPQNGTTWIPGCISPLQAGFGNFVPGTSFPTWTHAVPLNYSTYGCKATPFN